MTKDKARDILREMISYMVNRGRLVEGLEDFITDCNDTEDFLIAEYFNK